MTILLAQAATQPSPFGPQMILMFGIIFAIWWFLLIRPQRQQEKKHREMLDALGVGEKVVTTGGLLGTIAQAGPKTIKLKVADNVKIEVLRSAIARKQTAEDEPGADRPKDQ